MLISRRAVLKGFAAVPCARKLALCQEGGRLTLELPDLELDPKLDIFAVVNTVSRTKSCQVQVVDRENKIVLESQDWGTEPNQPMLAQLPGEALSPQSPYTARAVMDFGGNDTRDMVMLVGQAKTRNFGQQLTRMSQVRFVDDPVRPPVGHFELEIMIDSSVDVKVFKGAIARGPVLYHKLHSNLSSGPNIIPWDLKTTAGARVPQGRYCATLCCTPVSPGLHATNMLAYFGVPT